MSPLRSTLRRFPHTRPLFALGLAILAVEVVGASGAIFTAQGLGEWYGSLRAPALAPPNWVFGPVWTALFALIGTGLWLVWRQVESSPRDARRALWVLIVATMWAFDRVDRRAALLLVPYLVWVSFAVYLNYRFWVLN
ncbi:MAG: TspO/MBR family protein [Haloarculaceae archaeon]